MSSFGASSIPSCACPLPHGSYLLHKGEISLAEFCLELI